jgi:hypothetical protein
VKKIVQIFANPNLPQIDDYYEPFTYDYARLQNAPLVRGGADRATGVADHRREDGKDDLGSELGGRPRRRVTTSAQDRTSPTWRRRCTSSSRTPSTCICRGSAITASTRPASHPVLRGACTSARKTASCWPTRIAAAAGACASRVARTRRCSTTGSRERPRSASAAIRASNPACRPSVPSPASGASATTASSSMTPTSCSMQPASTTTRICTRHTSICSSTRTIPGHRAGEEGRRARAAGSMRRRSRRSTRWPCSGRSPSRCIRSSARCR